MHDISALPLKRLIMVLIFAPVVALSTTGCDSTVTNFVRKAKPKAGPEVPTQSNSPIGIKVSPGHFEAVGGDISAQATVTPTNQFVTGGGMSARIGISRTRVK
jgi:hypothetical protein